MELEASIQGPQTLQNPSHGFVYAGNGQSTKFKITLTVTNAAGSDVVTKNNYITGKAEP